jgi:hypothetical protein
MGFTWDSARLQVRFAGGTVGIFDRDDGAVAGAATTGSQPAGLGLIPFEEAGSLSGECAGWSWAAGRRSVAGTLTEVEAGPHWITVKDGDYWLACGPLDDAPSGWEFRRSP